jgi:hypothetical protein
MPFERVKVCLFSLFVSVLIQIFLKIAYFQKRYFIENKLFYLSSELKLRQ